MNNFGEYFPVPAGSMLGEHLQIVNLELSWKVENCPENYVQTQQAGQDGDGSDHVCGKTEESLTKNCKQTTKILKILEEPTLLRILVGV